MPRPFLPFVLLMLSREEDWAWHALSSSWQLPWEQHGPGGQASEPAEPLLSLAGCSPHPPFLCRLSSRHLVSLWCCLPPTLQRPPFSRNACFHCCLARSPFSFSLKPRKMLGPVGPSDLLGRLARWGGSLSALQSLNQSQLLFPSSCCLSLPWP